MDPEAKLSESSANRPSRRTMLRGVAAAGALGASAPLLAACGSDETTTTSGGASTSPAPSSPAPSSTEGSGGGGGGKTLGPTAQVPVGGGKIYPAQKVVVTQPAKGDFKAFSAICTHQGCTVGSVQSGTINCPCHGSAFDIATGKPVSGPATAPLGATDVKVEGDSITLS